MPFAGIRVGLYLFVLVGVCLLCRDVQSANSPTGVEPVRAAKLRQVLSNANQSLEKLGDYRVRFRRREVVAGKQCHEDVIMLTIRQKPFAVHAKCLPGCENEGREILYVAGESEENLHVLTGKGDVLSGLRMEVPLRSETVTSHSRRGLDQAGFTKVVHQFGLAVDRYLSGQYRVSEFEPIGLQTRAESRAPMEVVVQNIPANEEPLLPHGGTRYWHFNADADAVERHLPTLIITFDEKGQEVEYYLHDRLLPQVTLDAQDFAADRLGGK